MNVKTPPRFAALQFAALLTLLALSLINLVGCTVSDVAKQTFTKNAQSPLKIDSLPEDSLRAGIRAQLRILQRRPEEELLQFGSRSVSVQNYVTALTSLLSTASHEELLRTIFKDFEIIPAGATNRKDGILVTGYFEPSLKGSLQKTAQYSQAIYKMPEDLLTVNLNRFPLSPRLHQTIYGRAEGKKIVPYFSRKEIDQFKKLSGRGLELAFADPLEVFFLQIQGSGLVELSNGKLLRLNFAGKNGHPYRPIGALFRNIIPIEEMSSSRIIEHVRSLNSKDQREILNFNPSYVFFRNSDRNAVTASGEEAIEGRTIATDSREFVKGSMGYLAFDDDKLPPRIVFDQDVGGAIRGKDRLDLFTGRGVTGGELASGLRSRGRYYYLVPKQS